MNPPTTNPDLAGAPPPSRLAHAMNLFFASFGFVALRFILSPIRLKILAELLTKEQYGTLTLVNNTVMFVMLVSSLGSLEFLLRKIPGRPDGYQNGIFKTILLYFGGLSVALALAGMAWLAWQPMGKIHLSGSDILACGLLLVLTVHLNQYFHYFLGLSKYALSRIAQLLQGDTWFIPLIPFFWWGSLQVGHILWIWVIWLALTTAIMQRWIHFDRVWPARASRTELAEVLRFGVPLVPLILGERLFMVQDRYVLVYFMDTAAVANYALCTNIAMVGLLVGLAVLDILLIEFFKLRNQLPDCSLQELAGHAELRHHLTHMLRYALLIGLPFSAALVYLGDPIIRVLSSAKFLDATPILVWLAPLPLFSFLFVILGRVMLGFNENARVGAATLAAAIINIELNLILVPRLGERGAALAAVSSYVLLVLYLGGRMRIWRWLIWSDLKPVRLLLLLALSLLGCRWSAHYLAGWGSLAVLAAALAWMLLAMVLLGLMHKSDLNMVLGTFARKGGGK